MWTISGHESLIIILHYKLILCKVSANAWNHKIKCQYFACGQSQFDLNIVSEQHIILKIVSLVSVVVSVVREEVSVGDYVVVLCASVVISCSTYGRVLYQINMKYYGFILSFIGKNGKFDRRASCKTMYIVKDFCKKYSTFAKFLQ